jgi:hypothetical protein
MELMVLQMHPLHQQKMLVLLQLKMVLQMVLQIQCHQHLWVTPMSLPPLQLPVMVQQ